MFRKPVVALISTGDKIVSSRDHVAPGQVRDINSFTLAGLIMEEGGIPHKKGIFKDDYDTIRNAVEEALVESDMVLVIGGTSASMRDMTAKIIDEIGKPGVLFHGVAVKPGKPLIGGLIGGKPVLGLRGHPAAAVCVFRSFYRPANQEITNGIDERMEFKKTIIAVMGESIA